MKFKTEYIVLLTPLLAIGIVVIGSVLSIAAPNIIPFEVGF